MANSRYTWLIFAIASGACAAINGTFAKLTTGPFTTSLSASLSSLLGLSPDSKYFEYALRALFFALNLSFDALMWGLFTRALTLAASTVHVSVLNTSTNFLVAATAGRVVFGEKLPGLWWCGAGLLVGGCFVIGRREGRGGQRQQQEEERIKIGEEEMARGEPVDLDEFEDRDNVLPAAKDRDAARNRSPYRDEEIEDD